MSELVTALEGAIAAFDRMQIPYALMGGLAVRTHGLPRPTYDVDFAILIDRDRLPSLFAELDEGGYTVSEKYRRGWTDSVGEMPLFKFQLFIGGRSVAVDVFLAETAFLLSAIHRRQMGDIDGVVVKVVTPEDLIVLKVIANRLRDRADILDIRFTQGQLDEDYIRHWIVNLGLLERFELVWRETMPEE